jgi:magnesium transporter
MIVDCAVYEQGRRKIEELGPAEAFAHCQRDGAFVWLGLYEPTEEEFDSVRREFHLHELAVEDAIKAHQRPKVELYEDTLVLVLKPVRYVDEEEVIETGEILLFAHKSFVLTVRHREASALGPVRRHLEGRPDLLAHGPGAVLYAISDRVVDDYGPAADGLGRDIDEIEEQVFATNHRENPAERIYKLEREVLEFHRAVTPLVDPIGRLAAGGFDLIHGDLQAYFRDVQDHALRITQRIDGYRDLLSSVLHANLTQVSVRQNEDMRKITAWVAILAIPTMVAGIYGMNFEHMPELKWRFGYPAVMLVVLIACVLLYRRFRRAGWL